MDKKNLRVMGIILFFSIIFISINVNAVNNADKKIEVKKVITYPDIEYDVFNYEDHIKYISGYPDNTIRPDGEVSREEFADIIYTLLNDDYKNKIKIENISYNDVDEDRWSYEVIKFLSSGDIINGYADGSFRPENKITRAEVVSILNGFKKKDGCRFYKFDDIGGHWAENAIKCVTNKPWMAGYLDGSFQPDKKVTRKEIVVLMNRLLDRKVLIENMTDDIPEFNDLGRLHENFEDFQEAANTHKYEEERLEDNSEIWIEIID